MLSLPVRQFMSRQRRADGSSARASRDDAGRHSFTWTARCSSARGICGRSRPSMRIITADGSLIAAASSAHPGLIAPSLISPGADQTPAPPRRCRKRHEPAPARPSGLIEQTLDYLAGAGRPAPG
jgi:hypothetical protein